MIGKIIEEIRLLIEEKSDIFDKESRDNFLHKLNEMELVRNLDPFELSNIPLMEDCYKNIGVQYDDNIESVLETIKTYMSKLKDSSTLDSCSIKIFQYGKYLRTYVQSNVMYHPTSNKLIVNSDALKEPSFSRYFPNSLNYGYIGFTIAREILRAFDSDNRNKSNVTQFSIEHFKEKSDCFIKRYRLQKENITAKYINDQTTLAKDIVDNGGLKIVHRTYMKYLQSIGGEELNVPDFEDFTSEQLFFFSFGRNFCAHKTKNYTENQINTDEHILSEMRTNVALSNYEPFSNAFKCKLKRKMNPEHKCEL
uniref:Peptidase_M13 domain-containing protein n=1 Tax=Strongyloides papillosus TaxID=174720 RepID=A0A0N5BEN1_STREA